MGEASNRPAKVVDVMEGAVVEVIDPRLGSVHIQPNPDDEVDERMPRNLHNAAEVFVKTRNVAQFRQLQATAMQFFQLMESRPQDCDIRKGEACICWECGSCGIERQEPSAGARVCNVCGESSRTNYVQVVLADGVAIPWMEAVRAAVATGPIIEDLDELVTQRCADDGVAEQEAEDAGKLRIDHRLQSFQVQPNAGEDDHPNFPKNLLRAMELLLRVGHMGSARQLMDCTNKFFQLLEEGPDAGQGKVGQGYVCFNCGFCGLVRADGSESKATSEKACCCRQCGDDSHTNLVQLVLPNGQELPWMERDSSV